MEGTMSRYISMAIEIPIGWTVQNRQILNVGWVINAPQSLLRTLICQIYANRLICV